MEQIRVAAATADPPQVTPDQFRRAADHQRLCARIGINLGTGLMIIGAVLVTLGLVGADEFVADGARIVSIPTGLLFAVAGAMVVWITRPTLIR